MFKCCEVKWADVNGFEGLYMVNTCGDVYSIKRELVMKQQLNDQGYCKVTLYKNQKKYVRYVHRLVALAFIDNPNDKNEVNHINGNKQHNDAGNLEWCTGLENVRHGMKSGLITFKVTDEQILSAYNDNTLSIRQLCLKLNISPAGNNYKRISRLLNSITGKEQSRDYINHNEMY